MKNMELTEKELHKEIKYYENRLRFLAKHGKGLEGLTPEKDPHDKIMMADNIVDAIKSDSRRLVETLKELRENFGIQHKSYIPPGAREIFSQEAYKLGEKAGEITTLETPFKKRIRKTRNFLRKFGSRIKTRKRK
ncbi:hypothetical protein IIC68_02140 [archaeon]|nr:hypothetical protein [archaeon]